MRLFSFIRYKFSVKEGTIEIVALKSQYVDMSLKMKKCI